MLYENPYKGIFQETVALKSHTNVLCINSRTYQPNTQDNLLQSYHNIPHGY